MGKLLPFLEKNRLEAGCDEAGRGCLCGPVFAAAVILNPDFDSDLLDDSKKLNEKVRDALRIKIEEEALAWSVAQLSPEEIDEINILHASIEGMHRALNGLKVQPDFILVDGNKFKPYPNVEHACIVKGDSKYKSIAAASILAKTHRDDFMKALDKDFPGYGWAKNKGYPTVAHRDGIRKLGPTIHHRKTFRWLPVEEGNE